MRKSIRSILAVAALCLASGVGCSSLQYNPDPRAMVDINSYREGRALVAIILPFSNVDPEYTFLDVIQTVDFGSEGKARTFRLSSNDTYTEGVSVAIIALKPGHYEFENVAYYSALTKHPHEEYANFKAGSPSPILRGSDGTVEACLDKATNKYVIDVNPWDFSISSSSLDGCI